MMAEGKGSEPGLQRARNKSLEKLNSPSFTFNESKDRHSPTELSGFLSQNPPRSGRQVMPESEGK